MAVYSLVNDKNLLGDLAGYVYPRMVEDLSRIYDYNYTNVVLAGGVGWGKTTMANIMTLKLLEELTILNDPQQYTGLGKNEPIHIINLVPHGIKELQSSISEKAVRSSPRLMSLKPVFTPGEIRFPKNIMLTTCYLHDAICLGCNIVGCFVYLDSKSLNDTSKAEFLLNAVKRRIMGRFFGRVDMLNSKLVVVGYSKDSQNLKLPNIDYMNRYLENHKEDPHTLIIEHGIRSQ